MKRRWLTACAVAAACGGDGGSMEDRLQGDWFAEDSDAECTHVLSVEGDVLQLKMICELDEGDPGLEVHTGKFMLDGDELSWTLRSSTCRDPSLRPPTSMRVMFVGNSLRLVTDTGVIVFNSVEARDIEGGAGTAVEFGCFDEDDFFEPSPLEKT